MNKDKVLQALNTANNGDLISINVFSKPFEFEKSNIIYDADQYNLVIKSDGLLQTITLNSIKSISIIRNNDNDLIKSQIERAMEVKRQLEEKTRMSI